MELSFKKIQNMDSDDIFSLLLPMINDIYQSFQYIDISEQEYKDLVLKEIAQSKNEERINQSYSNYLHEKIRKLLAEKTRELIQNTDYSFQLISNYIKLKFSRKINYENAIKNFNRLNTFFDTYHYFPDPDVLIQLVSENSIITQMTETVLQRHYSQITSGNSEIIFDNSFLISTVETYCMLENIEIKVMNSDLEIYDATDVAEIDSVTMYLKEIGEKPLLTIEQERELLKRISEEDQEARDIFLESNLKLVVSVAKRYQGRGLAFLDLIQEGNLGLMTAVEKYDRTKSFKFSTYATWWIRQAITRAIANKGRNVRVPVYIYERIKSYKKVSSDLELILNRQPTIKEIANRMGLSIKEVTKLYHLQIDTVSIHNTISDEDNTELANFISAPTPTPEDIVIEKSLPEQLQKLLKDCNLKQREIDVLLSRFGFNNREPMTLENLSKKYHLTREGIRQIESRAIDKIRRSPHIKELAIYMKRPEEALRNIKESREQYFEKKRLSTKNQQKRSKKMPRLQTIYEYFKDYTKEQVDSMLSKLTDDEKALLELRYGTDLEHPVSKKLDIQSRNRFYGCLVPKMKKILENPNYKSNRKKRTSKINETDCEENGKIVMTTRSITKEDGVKMLELLRTPTFEQMLSELTVKEAVIISLRLGYVDEKCFSTEAIAQFLGIGEEEIRETTKKVLTLYKENVNRFLDDVIQITNDNDGNNRVLTKYNNVK